MTLLPKNLLKKKLKHGEVKKLPIRWDKLAKENLNQIFDFIALDSITAAQYVKK